jgi:flagellar hook-associated protein 1 FlgK
VASLTSLLGSTAGGLSAAQQLLATAGHNTSNVNTPGYTRQTANLLSTGSGSIWDPGGVTIGSVTQSRDRYLEAQIPAAFGQASFSQSRADTLGSITALNPSAAQGLAATLGTFYSSLRALSQNAGDTGLRQGVLSAAQALARSFNQTSDALTQAQGSLDGQISATVSTINTAAAQVASLNQQIRTAKAAGRDANDLLDARQQAQDQLSQLTGALPISNDQGDVSLALPGGQMLVSGDHATTLSAAADPGNGGHVALQLPGGEKIPAGSVSGQVGGWLSARDGTLAAAASALDTLATDFASAVNTAHQAGYALDGTTGHALFTVTPGAGAASKLAVASDVLANPKLLAAASSATAGPGDASNLQAVLGTETGALASSGASVGNTFSALVSGFGAAASQASAEAQHDAAIKTHLSTLRESSAGVSVDEELINIQKAQRAYEAVSKVFNTTSAMLDVLMQLK